MSMRQLAGSGVFWLFVLLMVCSGASEQAMSQWASAFAESALQVGKTMGDLLGPCLFALLMGTSRAVYARFSRHMPLIPFMVGSGFLCIAGYLLAVWSKAPVMALMGCGLCGLSVGILCPDSQGRNGHGRAAGPGRGRGLFPGPNGGGAGVQYRGGKHPLGTAGGRGIPGASAAVPEPGGEAQPE